MASESDSVLGKLTDPNTRSLARIKAASDLRDSLAHYVPLSDYPVFLEKSIPILVNLLRTPCILQAQTEDQLSQQELRKCILEILHKFSTSPFPPEPFEPHAEKILDLLVSIVKTDNEVNVVLCVNIISNVVQHQHKALTPKLQALLSLISELFNGLDEIVTEQLDSTPPESAETTFGNSQMPLGPQQPPRPADPGHQTGLLKGTQSFKVLSECPTIAMAIFHAYEHAMPQSVKLLPLIKSVLCCQAKAQEQAHKDGAAKGVIFTGVSPNIKNRAAFGEFTTAQVKIMSLLAYLLQKFSGLADSHRLRDFLPDIVIRLLKDCPREKPEVRKELLVAIRSIVNFNFRMIFLPKIDDLLDERILIGDGFTAYETLRPLAYSMMADLIHHVREDLPPGTMRKVVEVYTKNLLDNLPGTSFQTMSSNLLLNMAEPIAKMLDKVNARHYLTMILNAIGDKFAAMNRQYSNAVKLSKLNAPPAAHNMQRGYLADNSRPPEWDETDIFLAGPIKTCDRMERASNPVADDKFLLEYLMHALKKTLDQLETLTLDPANTPAQRADALSVEEAQVLIKLVREGAAMTDTLKIFATLCVSDTLKWDIKEKHLDALREMGEGLERCLKTVQLPSAFRLAANQATDQLGIIFTKWLEQAPEGLDDSLGLVDAIATGKLTASPNLLRGIVYKHVICNRSVQFLNTVILRCLDVYTSSSANHILRDIVNPIVATLVQQQGDASINDAVIESVRSKIWKPDPLENPFQPRISHTDMEALQLTAMLVKYHPTRLRHMDKDIINFAHANIRQDDAMVKYAAYVLIGYCIALYEIAIHLVLQTYFALLEDGPEECRALILQGLKLIAPVMPERCQMHLEDKNPGWAVGLRQVLAASRTTESHTATLLQFVIGQEELFYHSRDMIVIPLIDCLRKVAAPSGSCNIRRKLAMGVMELIWAWEHRRVNCSGARQFVIPAASREKMIEYLVESITQLQGRCEFPSTKVTGKASPVVVAGQPPSADLRERAMALLFNLLQPQYWGDLGFPTILEKVLAGDVARAVLATSADAHAEKHIDEIINAFQVVCIILHLKSKSWIVEHMPEIQKVLGTCLESKKSEIQKQVRAAQECGIFHKIRGIVQGGSFTLSTSEKAGEDESAGEKAEECTRDLGKPRKAQGFVRFILGMWFWLWMKPAKPEGQSQRSGDRSCGVSEKSPIPK